MSDNALSVLAPAKLNLFLHILGRRNDGYHNLQSLFQLLDFGDDLHFETDTSGTISLHLDSNSEIKKIPMDDNLIIRATELLRANYGRNQLGVSITLTKRIPIGSGLGGGSSNAAATLKALNKLWNCGLEKQELATMGLELGADVPVFVLGKSAWAEGVGEKLEAIEIEPCWYLIINPNSIVSTAQIFSQENLTRNSPAIKMADFLAGSARVRNDCELVTKKLYPKIEEAHSWLSKHAETRMTGTGASVFAKFTSEKQARAVLEQAPKDMRGFVAEGVNSL